MLLSLSFGRLIVKVTVHAQPSGRYNSTDTRVCKTNTITFHMHSSTNKNYLNYQGIYPCPVCRINQLKGMPLMDAMACDCCRHIFTVDLERQRLKMADRHPPLIWQWNGRNWKGAHLEGVDWGWASWLFAVSFIVLPASIIGLTAYTFPPSPDSTLAWLPIAWTGLTFLLHLAIVGWLVLEFYQFPVRAYLRARFQQLFGR